MTPDVVVYIYINKSFKELFFHTIDTVTKCCVKMNTANLRSIDELDLNNKRVLIRYEINKSSLVFL